MKNKIIIIGITFLFLIPISGNTINSESSNNDILYVDDDGGADYTRIQDAIDNASDGDTIFVYNGVYHEFIRINKSSIQLKGESKHSTIIDGSGSDRIIFITSSWISISNFTITNCSESGIGIQMGDFISSTHITLENNIILDIGYGILSPSTLIGFGNRHLYHRIINNEIRNSRICAIEFSVTDMSIIKRRRSRCELYHHYGREFL